MCSRFSYCQGGDGYLSLVFLAEPQEIKGSDPVYWLPVVVFPSGVSGNQGQTIQSTGYLLLYFLAERQEIKGRQSSLLVTCRCIS